MRIGAETQAAGFEGGTHAIASLVFEFAREFHNENGVLARETNKYDESNLREYVVVAFAEPHSSNGRQQSHRHNENYGKRQRPTFVLCSQHEKREQHAQWKHEQRRIAAQNLLVRQLRPLELHAIGQRFFRQPFHDGHSLSRTHTRRRTTVHFGGGIRVVSHHAIGTIRGLDRKYRTQWHHFAT